MTKKVVPELSRDRFGRRTVQSVDRALDILETLAAVDDDLRLNDIAAKVGLNISTCHHLISTLVMRGYASQNPVTRGYHLGDQALALADVRAHQTDFFDAASSEMRDLYMRTGESVCMAILQDYNLVNLIRVDNTDSEVYGHQEDPWRNAAHATARGKAILAWLPKQEVEAFTAAHGLARFTPNTITTIDALNKELRGIRSNDIAFDREEYCLGMFCIGVPLRDENGAVIGSISVSMPTERARTSAINKVGTAINDSVSNLYMQLKQQPIVSGGKSPTLM
ncbi:MAG: IclR family transcriptional regulator [Hyphomicrobiales bacterium]|nr:IclR family transcriptional regulator [Hyphomicrobiales bacterium]